MVNRKITIFTIDRPTLDGTGKSIRMMHWLAHLAAQYQWVYCVYFTTDPTPALGWSFDTIKNVEWIVIPINPPGKMKSIWRRFFTGLVYPLRYNLSWYGTLSGESVDAIQKVIKQSNTILFFRLYLYPLFGRLRKYIPAHCQVHLDLDDAEGSTHRQLLSFQWKQKLFLKYIQTRIAYRYVLYYEKRLQADFNTIYFSNPLDSASLNQQFPELKVIYFPNKLDYRPFYPKSNNSTKSVNILFCGALNYYPNEDAVYYLLNEIWPMISASLAGAKLVIAGSRPAAKLIERIATFKNVALIANPPSMKPIFKAADMMMVPLRLGGGTRIKILEAFSYGVPVISTGIGMHGLLIQDKEAMLVADSPEALSAACVDLVADQALYKSLVLTAYKYYVENHSYRINQDEG